MTTTQTTTATFDNMVDQFLVARRRFAESRMGSATGNGAERRMNDLVAKAERLGFLAEFCRTVNSRTANS